MRIMTEELARKLLDKLSFGEENALSIEWLCAHCGCYSELREKDVVKAVEWLLDDGYPICETADGKLFLPHVKADAVSCADILMRKARRLERRGKKLLEACEKRPYYILRN